MDGVATAYVTLTAAGTDVLLTAADYALRCELPCRICEDLFRLGLVRPGPGVTIADGTVASCGDLIMFPATSTRSRRGNPAVADQGPCGSASSPSRHGRAPPRARATSADRLPSVGREA
jgi:hypothetical protein